ncbi:MAG: hypothetical protein WD773_09810 [Gemmatimonadales bacterium]
MRRPAFLFLSMCLAPVVLAAQQPTPPPPPAPAGHDSLQGAVQRIDAGRRTLDVTTGVGFALRVVQLEVPMGVPVVDKEKDAPIPLRELKPGDVIRVLFGVRSGRDVAYTIERLGRMETGPDATP